MPEFKNRSRSAEYNSGDRVKHRKFGTGTVISAKKTGGDTILEIAFEEAGSKKMIAEFAPLNKIGR